MKNTRVEKYKEYRTSLIKEGTSGLNRKPDSNRLSSTDTLPFDTVMEEVKENNFEIEQTKNKLKKKYIISTCVISGIIILVAIIVIIAIVLFRR